ncbi:type VI secretion system tube protein Hcp [Emticicia sp. SJ17W-69]|uniref:type VI secretion system tube protein Hcp n=1 Tax=Emticicia sp. SJ17W-69 TaxID=3421657 RepID=UPI003EBE1CEB
MKKTILILLLLLCQKGFAQITTVMFLDIPTVDGEYVIVNANRTTVTPAPTKTSNLLISNYSFSWVNDTRIVKGTTTSTVKNGKVNLFGEMTVNFQIDKSVIALFDRLVNNTNVPIIDLFIDKPANIPTPQTEIKRIRMEGVTISELSLTSAEIPQYYMKLKFEKVSIIEHNINGVGVVTKGTSYGWNFLTVSPYSYSF